MAKESPKKYVGHEVQFFEWQETEWQANRDRFRAVVRSLELQAAELRAALRETNAAPVSEKGMALVGMYEMLLNGTVEVKRSIGEVTGTFESMLVSFNDFINSAVKGD